tara:strand:- start:840 stop:1121 length:282 start_codon:yes stop_codon:yes gene_type:complete
MSGKGDKWRGGWTNKYADSFDRIFNKKGKKKMKHIKHAIKDYMDEKGYPMIEKDKCVMCGAKTEYDKDTHIDNRKYYIEGAGQMCEGCHTRIY